MPSNNSALCIGFCEIDRHAEAVYRYHYDHRNYGDATNLVPDELPDFDFLIAGFPCQSFSIAGKRQGFNDTRGTLFFEIARVLSHKRPAHFLLENVGGLASDDEGKTQQTILEVLASLGYFVERPLLNSKDYGVPQNRERVFFIGHLGGRCSREILSFGNSGREFVEERRDTAYCLDANYYKGCNDTRRNRRTIDDGSSKVTTRMLQMEETKGNSQGSRVYHAEGISAGPKSLGGGGSAKCPMIVERAPLKYPNRNGKRVDGEYAFTVDTVNTGGVKVDSRIRRLTPIECERLQGLPDDYTKLGRYGNEIKEVSDTQRYKGLGNAFTVNVVEALITKMREVGCL